jgi:hypothetical protein
VVWLRNALHAGTFEEGARHSPPYRGTVANAVYDAVRQSMKGKPEPLVERAVLQARREADFLYQVVVNANMAVFESSAEREREYIFLLGYLSAEMRGTSTKGGVQHLRLAVLMFIEPVIILDAAIAQVASERLDGQPVLFRDSEQKLQEQLQMAETLSKHFNPLAHPFGIAEINLDELRNCFQSETDGRISIWASLARMQMLTALGKTAEMHAAMDRHFLLVDPKSGEKRCAP